MAAARSSGEAEIMFLSKEAEDALRSVGEFRDIMRDVRELLSEVRDILQGQLDRMDTEAERAS